MNPAEIRAIAYAVVAALLVGVGAYFGFKYEEGQWNIDRLAQASALVKVQTDLAAALADRVQLQQQVAKQNDDLKAKSDALVGSVSDSLRTVQAALRATGLYSTVGTAGAGAGTSAKPGGNSGLELAFARVGDAIKTASSACLHDAREITIAQAAAPEPKPR